MSNASFYASGNCVLGENALWKLQSLWLCWNQAFRPEESFQVSFFFPPHTKPNYLLAIIQGFHLPNCQCMSSPLSTQSYQTPRPVLHLSSKPIPEIPSFQDSQQQFPVQHPVPHIFWNSLLPPTPSIPPALSKISASQITPLGDQSYRKTF